MRLVVIGMTGALVSTLAACGQSGEPAQPAEIAIVGEQQQRLFDLDETGRNIALKRAVRAAGYSCATVERSAFAGDYENLSMWAVDCGAGNEWAIFVGADDTAQARRCADVVEAGLPACSFDEDGMQDEPADDGMTSDDDA